MFAGVCYAQYTYTNNECPLYENALEYFTRSNADMAFTSSNTVRQWMRSESQSHRNHMMCPDGRVSASLQM